MPDVRFIPRHDPERAVWLKNFAAELPQYAPQLHLGDGDVEQLAADAAVFDHLCRTRAAFETYTKALTARRDALRDGGKLGDFPQPPQLEPPPPGALAGIFKRAGQLAQRVKVSSGYASHIGAALGLIAPKKHPLDLAAVQPKIEVIASPGLQPLLKWKKGRLPGVQIWADYGDGSFVLIDMSTRSTYADKHPLPPRGTAVVWRYKAIYFKDDKMVGQWSNTVSATVTG